MKPIFQPIWSWPTAVIVILAMLLLVGLTYPQRVRHLPVGSRRFLIGCRLLAAALLGWAILRPAVQYTQSNENTAVLYVLADASRSMQTADGPGNSTRRSQVVENLIAAQPQFADFGETIEVRLFDFSDGLTPMEKPQDAAEGEQTAIGSVLETLLEEAQSERVVGVLLLSDGAQRATAEYDIDPRQVARRLGELNVPIYTVGFGTTSLSTTVLDVAVDDLLVDPVVFEKKIVPVTARVRALGGQGRTIRVRLLVENRDGVRLGQSGDMEVPPAYGGVVTTREWTPTSNDDVLPVELSFRPELPGEYKLAVEAVPLEDELKPNNNRSQTIITVQRGGIRVAYFDKFRPEQKFVRLLNGAENIQLDFQLVHGGVLANRTSIDPQMFARGKYDVFIIGDVAAEAFGSSLLRSLASRVAEGAGLMMSGGFQSFGPGGYGTSPLAEILPVSMPSLPGGLSPQIDPDTQLQQSLKMVPTRAGLSHYVMRLANSAGTNREAWDSLAALQGASRLTPKSDFVEILAESQDGVPLLLAQESGAARVVAFAGDTTFQWVLGGHAAEHQRFWRQLILWLAKKEADGDKSIFVRATPRAISAGEQVTVEFGAREDTGEPAEGVEFQSVVVGPNGQTLPLEAAKTQENYVADFRETETPGDYWITVSGQRDGAAFGLSGSTRFIVDERDLELDNPVADLSLLDELATLTGGRSIPAEQFASFLQERQSQGWGNLLEERIVSISLWDHWSFLLAFASLMSLEWTIRKKRGLA